VRKLYSFETGSVDIASRQYSQQNKAPKLVLTIADTPCTITLGTPSPTANQYGWNHSDVTQSFTCNDPDGVSSCNSPQVTSAEGAQVCVTAQCVDTFGNIVTTSPCFKIDKTAPTLAITYPLSGATLDTCQPDVTGTVVDATSGVQSLVCNDADGAFANGSFSCVAALFSGADTIAAQATDVAGNISIISIPVTNTTSNNTMILDSSSPVVAAADAVDRVAISGEGFDDTIQAYLDGVLILVDFVNSTSIILSTNFTSAGVHSFEIKKPNSCPDVVSVLNPGVLAIVDGQVLAYPETISPGSAQALSVYGHPGSFESGATVYFAAGGSSCMQGLTQVQSVTFVEDDRLDVLTPSLSTGVYDLFVDNPEAADFCQANAVVVANPPSAPNGGYQVSWNCCGGQSILPPDPSVADQPYDVKLVVKNTGSLTWFAGSLIDLGSFNGSWAVVGQPSNMVPVPANVLPNKWVTFKFRVKAPHNPETYTFKWGMRDENAPAGEKWFGDPFPCTHNTCVTGACGYNCGTGANFHAVTITVTSSGGGGGGNCPASVYGNFSPDDDEPDTDAIQCRLYDTSNTTKVLNLVSGNPGYIINDGTLHPNLDDGYYAIVIPAGWTVRTATTNDCYYWDPNSNIDPKVYDGVPPHTANCARLVAAIPSNNSESDLLTKRMIKMTGGGQTIRRIIVDGQGEPRRNSSALNGKCAAQDAQHSTRLGNIYLKNPGNTSWTIDRIVSMNDTCGSALRVEGKGYTLTNNLVWNNGEDHEITGHGNPFPWSDGITFVKCDGGTISNNKVIDATDIAMVGGGTGSDNGSCNVNNNKVAQLHKHVSLGLNLGIFANGQGKWGSSTFTKNTIQGNDLMDFGIMAGCHPWFDGKVVRGGIIGDGALTSTSGNTVGGASINIAVDGWLGGIIGHNTINSASNADIRLAHYDCTLCDPAGQKFTVGDDADYPNSSSTGDYTKQDDPHASLILHVNSVPNSSSCNYDCNNDANSCNDKTCGGRTTCSICQQPAVENCACRNSNGNGECVSCPVTQEAPIDSMEE
jgi:hypothetical protein